MYLFIGLILAIIFSVLNTNLLLKNKTNFPVQLPQDDKAFKKLLLWVAGATMLLMLIGWGFFWYINVVALIIFWIWTKITK